MMVLVPSERRNITLRGVLSWLYRGSLGLCIILLIGFAAVMPIDSVAQASMSDNNAFNTFIVVGALVLFFIICVVIIVGRVLYHKSCLIDIPRKYLPITPGDLPHKESRDYLMHNMDRSKELSVLFKKPKSYVVHDGLEPPVRCDLPKVEKLFPEYLNYEACMKIVSNRIKYQGFFLAIVDTDMKLQDTFTDVITKQFINDNNNKIQIDRAQRLIDIYEYLQFSGKPIARQEFTEFVELCIYFADIVSTADRSRAPSRNETLTRVNTKRSFGLTHKKNVRSNSFDIKNHMFSNNMIPRNSSSGKARNQNFSSNQRRLAVSHDITKKPKPAYVARKNSTGTVANMIPLEEEEIRRPPVGRAKSTGAYNIRKHSLYDSPLSKMESFDSVIHKP